jgi:hypothetical protein
MEKYNYLDADKEAIIKIIESSTDDEGILDYSKTIRSIV